MGSGGQVAKSLDSEQIWNEKKVSQLCGGRNPKKSAKIVGYDGMPLVNYFSHGK